MSMGIFSRGLDKQVTLVAQATPQVMQDTYYGMPLPLYTLVSRSEAISVPSVARCVSLIKGTIGAIPLELYRTSTGEELGKPRWMEQPSISQPRSVTISATVDSMIFWGVAYWRVTEVYQEDLRPARFEWVSNLRVSQQLDRQASYVEYYMVDGIRTPDSGLGSLVTFQGLDPDGILTRGATTIRAAIDVQLAAKVAASTPMAAGFIKNTGADLDPKEVQGLLAAWANARRNRATAYLTSTLEYTAASFSPKDMMYQDAIEGLATEISRLCNVDAFYLSADRNNSMTYSNILDSRKQFVALTLQPFITAIEDRLSMDDITARGNYVKFDVDKNFLRTEPLQELAVIEKLLQLQLITVEQAMSMTDITPNGSAGLV